ncbi:MAG: phytanoyl-CoA dioxygenase family protein [Halobacteriaceae archaeon]
MTDPTTELSQAQVDSYREDGFLALDRITTDEEVDRLVDVYDRLFTTRTDRDERKELAATDEEGNETLPQVNGASEYEPDLLETRYFDNASAIAERLLGEEAEFRGDHAIRKPAGDGAETPWHQDEAYWDPTLEYDALSFWLPLQEATVENGCMQFVPGSHDRDVLPHHRLGGDAEGLEVDDPGAYAADATACELPAGGATVHDSRTLHYTGPNRTARPRRAYILIFGTPPRERDQPRDFYWQEE